MGILPQSLLPGARSPEWRRTTTQLHAALRREGCAHRIRTPAALQSILTGCPPSTDTVGLTWERLCGDTTLTQLVERICFPRDSQSPRTATWGARWLRAPPLGPRSAPLTWGRRGAPARGTSQARRRATAQSHARGPDMPLLRAVGMNLRNRAASRVARTAAKARLAAELCVRARVWCVCVCARACCRATAMDVTLRVAGEVPRGLRDVLATKGLAHNCASGGGWGRVVSPRRSMLPSRWCAPHTPVRPHYPPVCAPSRHRH